MRRAGEERRRNAIRSIDGFYDSSELASENEEESFGTLEHHQTGERQKRRERESNSFALFLLHPCLSCIILEFLLIVTRCIGNCKSTPWIMFLPRDRGESAVRLDSGGNSRIRTEGSGWEEEDE
jgi:hypothetical protein